jgi:hypothetical protein
VTALALPDLARAIEREHQAARRAARTALEHAMECGRLLIEAKAQVGHGGWLPWLEANCTLRPRTAQAYMRLARELPKLPEQEAQRVADSSVRDAIAQLSKQAHDLAALPEAAAAGVLEAAADERLRDVLVRACNREQQRASRSHDDHPGEWVTVELPPSLPPPDELLVALLAKEIERHALPPLVVLESLNAPYCRIQNQHQLVTRAGLPTPIDEAGLDGRTSLALLEAQS